MTNDERKLHAMCVLESCIILHRQSKWSQLADGFLNFSSINKNMHERYGRNHTGNITPSISMLVENQMLIKRVFPTATVYAVNPSVIMQYDKLLESKNV